MSAKNFLNFSCEISVYLEFGFFTEKTPKIMKKCMKRHYLIEREKSTKADVRNQEH